MALYADDVTGASRTRGRDSTKDVWFVDEITEIAPCVAGLKNIAQFDSEDAARNCSAIMWATTN